MPSRFRSTFAGSRWAIPASIAEEDPLIADALAKLEAEEGKPGLAAEVYGFAIAGGG